MPDSRSTWFWIMSKPAAVVCSPAIQSTPDIPPRLDGSGRGWRSPRGPPCSSLVRWHVWHERRTQRRRNPGPPRRQGAAPATPSWRAENSHRAGRHGSCGAPVRAAHRRRGYRGSPQGPVRGDRGGRNAPETSTLRCVCGVGDGGAVPIDEPAQRSRRAPKDWPEDRIDGNLRRQALYERRREEEAAAGLRRRRSRRALRLRGRSAQREFRAGESDEHTKYTGG